MMMTMPDGGVRGRLTSGVCPCGTRERQKLRAQWQTQSQQSLVPGSRTTRLAVPPASIWGKLGTPVAFSRRAAAAAGAMAGLQRRGARSGAPFDVEHHRSKSGIMPG